MKATLDHVGIAVSDLERRLAFYRDALGPRARATRGSRRRSGSARISLQLGDSTLGTARSDDCRDSPIAKFLAKRGPGLHHVALRVDDIVAALAELKARGVRLIDETPRPGAHGSLVAFLHPASTHGVLVELKQPAMSSRRSIE